MMHLHFSVRRNESSYAIGEMLCPVVPRIGETVYLNMSLGNLDWALNPAHNVNFSTAYLLVENVAYEGYNVLEVEEGMGAAPLMVGSAASTVWLYVTTKDEHTQAYIDRVVEKQIRGEAGEE